MNEAAFHRIVLSNHHNRDLLARLPQLGLPDCWLTAGCLFQTLWNDRAGNRPDAGIKDYDLFYFDSADLSKEAEIEVEQRARAAFSDLPITLDVKNQARVHLWYPGRFGAPYPQLINATDGIDRYLVTCTCIGISVASGALHAPDGLADLAAGKLRINPRNAQPERYREKSESYQQRWPWLEICD